MYYYHTYLELYTVYFTGLNLSWHNQALSGRGAKEREREREREGGGRERRKVRERGWEVEELGEKK